MEHSALATLAVQQRESSRYLLFDEGPSSAAVELRPNWRGSIRAARATNAGAGLFRHPRHLSTFAKMDEEGAFSIDAYLHLAAQGEKIIAFRTNAIGAIWPENLLEAAQDLASGNTRVTYQRVLFQAPKRAWRLVAEAFSGEELLFGPKTGFFRDFRGVKSHHVGDFGGERFFQQALISNGLEIICKVWGNLYPRVEGGVVGPPFSVVSEDPSDEDLSLGTPAVVSGR